MPSPFCALPFLLLGAALAGPLFWLINRLARGSPARRGDQTVGILWLTEACRAALGKCAAPGRLRKMKRETIGTLLYRSVFPNGEVPPVPERYATWPEQARFICDGDFDGLRHYQDALRERFGDSDDIVEPSPASSDDLPLADRLLVLVTLALLLAAFVLLVFIRTSGWCEEEAPPCPVTMLPDPEPTNDMVNVSPGTTRTTVSLSTDLLFDYNRAGPQSEEHERKIRDSLDQLFRQFRNIRLLSLTAHTDPIGRSDVNMNLAAGRAAYIRNLIEQLVASEHSPDQFRDDAMQNIGSTTSGPGVEDFAIWRACFQEYYLGRPADRPLVDLQQAGNPENRVLCSRATAETGAEDGRFPACARPLPPGERTDVRTFARRAENFRELTACLGPMRHVVISFEHERQEPASAD